MEGNYLKILDKISRTSGLEKEELERRVEAKRAKLSGLISKEGAAQVIAAELGINFDNEKLKIDELLPGMRKVNTLGKVVNLSPVRTFFKNGKEGKVANLTIADDRSNIKVVLWDTNHISLIETNKIINGTVVEISNGSMRDYELHLGSFSELKVSKEVLDEVQTQIVMKEKNISDLRPMDNAKLRAFVVQIFDPRFFEVSAETGKKLTDAEKAAGISTIKKALLNVILDDGTETIRSVIFHDNLLALGWNLNEQEKFSFYKEDLLGKEMLFAGNVRMNNYFNNQEFIVDKVEDLNIDNLIEMLEK